MPGYTLVPVDYQPDFGDYTLVPVDYDPFAGDRVAQQSQIQYAQAQPQGPLQQQPATGAGQPDASAPAADGVLTPLREKGTDIVDTYVYVKNATGTPPSRPAGYYCQGQPHDHCHRQRQTHEFRRGLWTYAHVFRAWQQQFGNVHARRLDWLVGSDPG